MRRKDREVQSKEEIFDILRRCETIRISMFGEKYPYTVPISFALEIIDDTAIIYFHCATSGLKLDLLAKNPQVCVEGDRLIKVETSEHGITARYESVIGFGKCLFIEDVDEIKHGLKLLTEHYGYSDYPLDGCGGLQNLLVGKIVLEEITGKRNLPSTLTPTDK